MTRIREAEGEQRHRWPEVLPGGQAILYVVGSGGEWDDATIVAERLGTGQRTVLVKGGSSPRYLPTGHLVYARAGSIYAVKFDARSLAVQGAPVEVARNVFVDLSGAAQMDMSRTGIFLTGPADSIMDDLMLSWVDRMGRSEPLNAARQAYNSPTISPDGAHVAINMGNATAVLDLVRLTTVKLALPGRVVSSRRRRELVLGGCEKAAGVLGAVTFATRLNRRSTSVYNPSMSIKELEAEALRLDPKARARLAGKLLESLDELSEEEISHLWAEEAERRDADMNRNPDSARPAAAVLRDARSRLA